MDEYIKREAVIEAIMSEPSDAHYPQWYVDKIKSIPAADVAPVVHGRWTIAEDDYYGLNIVKCSVCHEEWCFEEGDDVFDLNYHYCPNCGAKMGKEVADGTERTN